MDNNLGQTPGQPSAEYHKSLIWGLSAAVVVLLALVIYLLTSKQANGPEVANENKTQDTKQTIADENQQVDSQGEMADWTTYTNTEYGFEFRYPVEFGDIKFEGTSFYTTNQRYGGIGGEILPKTLDPNNIQGLYGKIQNPTVVNVGNHKGYQYLVGDAGCGSLRTETVLGNKTLQLHFGYCEGDEGPVLYEDKVLVNKILSTFKFTSQNETAGWQTYTNKDYGFTLQFNDAWKGYRVRQVEMSSNFGAGSLIFEIPVPKSESSEYADIMQIEKLNIQYWNQIKNDGIKPTLLAQTDDYAFVAVVSNDWGVVVPGVELEISKVLSTFKLTK